ncbi:hypothetical protein [Heyndrickxia camelliae]|uniref:hypothetical protein n=1 Tax=Heyndrickxia camelliae TaxID=1707093 RepID=UPI0013038808|nr:hypothetical protein [Heyndrickxia camelliae]
MKIRIATIEDIKGLARVHYDSWKSTYTGIFSEGHGKIAHMKKWRVTGYLVSRKKQKNTTAF